MILTREQILEADDLKSEEIPVPEWGGSVLVRPMSGSERDAFEARYAKVGKQNIRAASAAASICDENGQAIFSVSDIEALGKKSAAALDRVADAALRLSKLSQQDVAQLEQEASGNAPPSA